ncbi:hypothetical protein LP417_15950 [Polaromonas sp. P1-6]|nr:hypothetical protein LP417_15950 [Polaromonas sp. P1-6]
MMTSTYPGVILALVLPLHLALLIMEGILLSLFKSDITLWRTIYAPLLPSLWQTRNKLLRLRQEIQEQRRISLKEWMAVFRLRPYKMEMLFKHGLPEVR